MMDYAALVAEARRNGHHVSDRTKLAMTPDLLGRMLLCMWASRFGRSEFPSRQRVERALFDHAATAPDDLRNAMTVESGVAGTTIAVWEEYLAGARADGLVSRLGRVHVVDMDRRTAEDILETLLRGREGCRNWLDAVVVSAATDR